MSSSGSPVFDALGGVIGSGGGLARSVQLFFAPVPHREHECLFAHSSA
jgi:hypothetical protein